MNRLTDRAMLLAWLKNSIDILFQEADKVKKEKKSTIV